MARYRVVLTPAAARQLDRLRGPTFVALRGVILALGDEPLPPTAGKIAGSADVWRLRVRVDGAPWRVVYQLRNDERTFLVTRVARRGDATYRRLDR